MYTVLSSSPIQIVRHQPEVFLAGIDGDLNTPHCPFVTWLNPQVARAEQQGLAWARRFELITSSKVIVDGKLEYVRFSAFVHPRASLERLQIVADFFTWLFLLDDEWDETPKGECLDDMARQHARFIEVLQGSATQARDSRFTHALADLRRRIIHLGGDAILHRFTKSASTYFEAGQWEAINRSQGRIPRVTDYLHMRTETGAVYPCFDLIQVTDHLNLPDSVLQHETVRRLSLLANRVISWCNDIYSAEKERQHEDVHNLVLVLQHENRCSFQKAWQQAVEIHNQDVAEFVRLATLLPGFSSTIDAQLSRYVDSLRTWMRANYEFSLTAARYHSALVS